MLPRLINSLVEANQSPKYGSWKLTDLLNGNPSEEEILECINITLDEDKNPNVGNMGFNDFESFWENIEKDV